MLLCFRPVVPIVGVLTHRKRVSRWLTGQSSFTKSSFYFSHSGLCFFFLVNYLNKASKKKKSLVELVVTDGLGTGGGRKTLFHPKRSQKVWEPLSAPRHLLVSVCFCLVWKSLSNLLQLCNSSPCSSSVF